MAKFGFSALNSGLNGKMDNSFTNLTAIALKNLITPVRVYSIVLDQTHPRFKELGEWNSLGVIEYTSVTAPEIITASPSTAKPLFSNIKSYPILNEIVFIIALPNTDLEDSTGATSYYYFSPVGLWNHPHHNAYPTIDNYPEEQQKDYVQIEAGSVRRVTDGSTEINLGNTFVERSNIHPLLLFEGDTLVEGRWSNSIRLGSTVIDQSSKQPKTTWSKGVSSAGDPIIIIRNGQPTNATKEGWIPIEEDVNQDQSSTYYTSTQQIPIQLASQHTVAYRTQPTAPALYNKPQIILNSSRILLNSTSDSILLSSINAIGLSSANTINLQAKNELIADSPKIRLGSKTATQAVLRGTDTVETLKYLMGELSKVMNVFSQVAVPLPPSLANPAGTPTLPLTALNQAAIDMKSVLDNLLPTLEDLKSKTVYTL